MEGDRVSRYAFMAVFAFLLYLAILMIKPFFTYLVTALAITVAVYPFYSWFSKKVKNKKLSSMVAVILILLVIVIPFSILISSLMIQTTSFVSSFSQGSFEEVNQYFDKINIYCMQVLGPDFNLKSKVNEILNGIQDFVLKSAAGIIGSIADAILGLFVMFFVIYYGFIEGKNWSSQIKDLLPLTKERKDKMAIEIKGVIHAVIYGQISIALLQGILGGLGFFIVGISNPVFWGFIMTILAFIPMTGTGFVWLPAGIIQLINGNILGGIFLLAYGFIIVSGIDNLIRPKIIAGKAKIHPVVALIGVLGGLKLFGFLGIIIGPLIAALFIAIGGFFYEDYVKDKH